MKNATSRLSLLQKKSGVAGRAGWQEAWKVIRLISLASLLVSGSALAQLTPAEDPDWTESEVPPPPAFDIKKLIRIDMERVVELRYGVDPAAIQINGDGVMRYVMVITSSSGNVSATYEGLRCATAEVKIYGRYNDRQWRTAPNPEWRKLYGNSAVRHALNFARQGACNGTAPQNTVADIVHNLKNLRSDLSQ